MRGTATGGFGRRRRHRGRDDHGRRAYLAADADEGLGTAYINIPQAAGLATERLSAHVGQRIRWARGMIQILRIDNPLLAPVSPFPSALLLQCHVPFSVRGAPPDLPDRAIDLPVAKSHNIPGFWAAILAYALPT